MEKNITELKFNIGDVIEYIGPRKALAPGQYVIKDINNDCYITNRCNIPIKFQEYYKLVPEDTIIKLYDTERKSKSLRRSIRYNKENLS